MMLSLLSSFTLMIRKLIYSPNLLIANGLNSFGKTLVLSPWIDLLFSFFLMHSRLFLCIALFNMFLFVYLLLFCFSNKKIKKKIEKSEKYKNNVCLYTLVFVYLGWPLKQSFLNFVSFVT